MTSGYLLRIDQRERAVFNTFPFKCDFVIEQLTVGDYVITRGPLIKAVFERKTLKDYGASIKDGRTQNVGKLLELRIKTGCDIFYIIEGPAFPSQSTEYAGIPYRNIASSIRNLQVRHGINIIKTQSEAHTVEELENFIATYSNTEGSMEKPSHFDWINGQSKLTAKTNQGHTIDITPLVDYFNGNINGAQLGEPFVLNPQIHDYMTALVVSSPFTSNFTEQQIQEHLTKKQETPISQEAYNAMKAIAGFGEKTASIAIRYSMHHYITAGVPSGLLPSEKARTLYEMREVQSAEAKDNCIRWLASIGGVSSQAAKSLNERVGYLRGISSMSVDALAKVQIVKKLGSGHTSVGPAMAQKIKTVFEFSRGAASPA